jgi:type I restriction enzyme S subunit
MNPELLLAHFNRISDAPDAVPRLRRLILDLAVRGKLVEQNPNDDPGSNLLTNVRQIKAQMVLERHIRREQRVEYPSSDIKMNLPSTWVWAYIDDVAIVQGGKRLPNGAAFSNKPTDHIYIRVTDMKNGTISNDDLRYIALEVHRAIARYTISQDDLYITIAGTIGQVGHVPEFFDGHNLTENAAKIVFRGLDSKYFCLALSSEVVQEQFRDKTKQMAQPKLALKRILGARFPLPPLAEQHRIVAKIDELMALCDRLEAAQRERDSRRDLLTAASHHHLNNGADTGTLRKHAHLFIRHFPRLTARPDQINQLRQTILNLAVRGQLVPQASNVEPASELVKRIQAEKVRLVKVGKLRRQVLQAEIEPEETPFELPMGWVWTRLGDVIHLVSGQHLQPSEYSDREGSGPPYITGPADFGVQGLVITRYALVRKAVAEKGQILLTVKGAGVGKTAICDLTEVAISRQLMAMTAIGWSQQFLLLVTHRLAETLKESARSLIPGISREDVDRFVFSLPPLTEQHRIVATVDKLMTLCDRLEAQLTSARTCTSRLLEAVLHHSLGEDAPDSAGFLTNSTITP